MGEGLAQIGWCQMHTLFDAHNGVGDDRLSYAFYGNRIKKWNGASEPFGKQCSTGDIIGTLIDI